MLSKCNSPFLIVRTIYDCLADRARRVLDHPTSPPPLDQTDPRFRVIPPYGFHSHFPVPHKIDRALQGGNRESLAVDPAASAVQPHRSTEAPLADDIEPLKNGSKCMLAWRRSHRAGRAQKEMAHIKRIYCSGRRAHYQERLAKQRQTLSETTITPATTAFDASWHQHPPSLQVEEGVQAETSAFECE